MEKEKYFAVVNGIGIGEETKGNTVQALVRELNAHTVWRSGGWQGGHHIIHDDGREMALNHFGAGVFEGANTYLKHMVISPVDLFRESLALENLGIVDPLKQIIVDESCIATTPFHSGISRLREILRGDNKKGTIGQGVGEAVKDSSNPELSVRAGEMGNKGEVLRKVENIRTAKLKIAEELISNHTGLVPEEAYSELQVLQDQALVGLVAESFRHFYSLVKISDAKYLDQLLKRSGAVVNEVSHGALHHPRHGFIPHITQIDPTSQDVISTVKTRNYNGSLIKIGVARTYLTRHGAGPFVSFSEELTKSLKEKDNDGANDWLGSFKVGYFDTVALKYAIKVGGGKSAFNGLFISYLDVLSQKQEWDVVDSYEYLGKEKNLEDFFVFEDKKIVGIKFHPDINKDEHYKHQVKLTSLLNDCRPTTTTLRATNETKLEEIFLDYVTKNLEIPVVGVACGPKISDKKFLPQWQVLTQKSK